MSKGRVVAAFVSGCFVLLLGVSPSTQVRRPVIANPDPSVQRAVTANASAIDKFLGTAVDTSAAPPSRISALNNLTGLYFDYLLANAEALVRDPNADVAQVTVLQLGGQIAMLPADGSGHIGEGHDAYLTHVVQESLRILRLGIDHPDRRVRAEAAGILGSRGDLQGMARIQAQIEAGQFAPKEGLSYLSLAPLDVGGPFIAPYLNAPESATRAAAVAPLSYDTKYTVAIRTMALNPQTPPTILRAALPGLAVSDKEFSTYGLSLVQNKALSRETREVALESTVKYTLKSNSSEGAVRALAPLLTETANELKSDRALAAVKDLKATYRIE